MKAIFPHLTSKKRKTAILLKHPTLKNLVPATRQFTRANLSAMLAEYDTIFIKPDQGRFGIGVMKLYRFYEGYHIKYRLQHLLRIRTYDSFEQLVTTIRKLTKGEPYILQRGIDMITYRDRPFDVRVMVQQSPTHKWETTGLVARVAAPRKIVTNFHAGGTARELAPLLSAYLSKTDRETCMRNLRTLGCKVAKHYKKHIKGLKEIGIDIAIDRSMQSWILEVNTRPDPDVFRALKQKSTYKKIYRYARKYGKYKSKST